MNKEGADHDSSPSFACFAMDCDNISWLCMEPVGHIFAERVNELERWWRMIREGELGHCDDDELKKVSCQQEALSDHFARV